MVLTRRLRPPVFALMTVPVFAFLYTFSAITALITWAFAYLNMKRTTQAIIRFWARSIFHIMGRRLRVKGLENIDRHKKYILIANHASLFDITAILAFYPGVSWFGRERLLRIPLFGSILRMIDYIPMTKADVRNTKHMLDQLVQKSEGLSIAMFPEGTRTLDGKLSPFHRGFVHLLKSTDLCILPVTLNGMHSLKPKNRFWIDFRSKLQVTIHKPIENCLLRDKKDHEIIHIVRETIQSAYQHG